MAVFEARRVALRGGGSVVVRAVEAKDAAEYLALVKELSDEGSFGTVAGSEDLILDVERQAEKFKKLEENGSVLQLVAIDDRDRLVGEARCEAHTHTRIRHVGRVSISLSRDFRGRGLGEQMMQLLIDWAAAHPKIERLTLAVFEPNTPARRLYEKLGFKVEGCREGEIKLASDRYADDLIMARWVKPAPAREVGRDERDGARPPT